MARMVKNYVKGQWVQPLGGDCLDVTNPSTGAVLATVPLSTRADTERAIQAAAAAFEGWSRTPVSRRVQPLFRLLAALRGDEEQIARTLVSEMGKSLPDARAELKRVFENIEVACGMPVLQQGEKMVGSAAGIDGEILRLPLGVFAAIAPFNFPAMVPFWFLPYALAAGNTFVLKPSEQTPLTMEAITAHLHQSGLPPGVFNLVNGNKAAAAALVRSPLVKGVSVVGSTATCRAVAGGCVKTGKRFQAMGGAKNHLVIMPDAKMDEVVRNMITSCYGCAGQRCMASSVIIAIGEPTYRTVCRRFIAESRKVTVANPLDPKIAGEEMVMGPVISANAKRFILDMIKQGIREKAKLALDGRGLAVPGCERGHFIGPTVFTGVKPGMKIHTTEIFGPVVCIMKAAHLDEAIDILNQHAYGNGASLYTQNGHWAREFKLRAECGMIGVNVGIPAPVAYLPFGGAKASLLSDIKAQGKSVINFFTQDKIITERYWPEKPRRGGRGR